MADSLDDRHGVCDWYNDPFCDPCFEGKGLNIKVHGYCKDCFQFLCSDCHIIHGKLQACRHHVFLQGASMPKSQADKPPKFEYCDRHQTLVNNKYCYEHKTLICTSCASDHRKCVIETVAEICKTVSSYDTDLLYHRVKVLHDQAKSVIMSVQATIKKVKQQKTEMLKEAQELHDKVISKVHKLSQDMQSEIEAAYETRALEFSQQLDRLDNSVSRLESSLNYIEKFRGKHVDTKMFLKIQDSVTDTNQTADELRSLNNSLPLFYSLALVPSKTIKELLFATFTLGSISKSYRYSFNPGSNIVNTKIQFPGSVPMKAIKEAVKKGTYEVSWEEDKKICSIGGLEVATGGRILLSDIHNGNVKMFFHGMRFLSSVSVPDQPLDIAMISETEVAITTYTKSVVILDVSGSQLSVRTRTQLSYDVHGISRYNNKLVVTSPDSKPPCVKLIDQTGRVYWSVSSDQQRKPLFSFPGYVSSPGDGRSSTVIVTDTGNDTLTLLNGDTGEVITRRQLKEKGPGGVTTDSAGNIYVCYRRTCELAVLSSDLSQEKILWSRKSILKEVLLSFPLGFHRDSDSFFRPKAVVFDNINHQLIVSRSSDDIVYYFKLS